MAIVALTPLFIRSSKVGFPGVSASGLWKASTGLRAAIPFAGESFREMLQLMTVGCRVDASDGKGFPCGDIFRGTRVQDNDVEAAGWLVCLQHLVT